jgi:hypothetical protein
MMPFERLVAWVLGDALDDAEAVEPHLFECEECTRVAHRLLDLRDAIQNAFRAGQLRFVATPALVRAMEDSGLELRSYDPAPGEVVPCSATPTQHYAITWFTAELADVSRVDVEIATQDGHPMERISDVPFSAEANAVILAETGDFVRSLPTMTLQIRLLAVEGDGRQTELGTYGLAHGAEPERP